MWSHTRVTGLFDAATDIQVVKQALQGLLHTNILPECRLTALEERDWVRAWLDDFQPMRFGRRLWVVPGELTPPDPAAINLRLDPGLAFGTGTHPSTALCLEWLEGQSLTDRTVLDYGCGSGILAIAAALLGAERVWAVDIDPQALIATDCNAATNAVGQHLEIHPPEALPNLKAEVVLANILAGPLIALAPRLAELTAPGGRLALAGLLTLQMEEVRTAYDPWFDFDQPRLREDWTLLSAVRRSL